jgi:alkylated DNA repair dioxygenase AlkB
LNTSPTGRNRSGLRQPPDLFGEERLPQGLKYQADFRTVSFGWRYDFNGGGLTRTEDMPEFLTELRAGAEVFAKNAPGSFQQVLVTEYSPGAGIGWHKDRSVFGDVVGISLLSPCTFRLRKRTRRGFERQTLIAAPRSIYLLRDASRTEWEHSIPAVESLRYSVTFRNVLERNA